MALCRWLPALLPCVLTACLPALPKGMGDSRADSDADADEDSDSDTDSDSDSGAVDVDGDGYTAAQGDCDDTDPTVNPAAAEDCLSPADDNCDGTTNDEDALGCRTFYADIDGDGYGSDSACFCSTTATYNVTIGGDCDDASVAANPGEAEVCENFLDDDCDGSAAACALADTDLTSAAAKFTGVAAGDYAGSGVAGVGDVDLDGYDDFVIGAHFNGDAGVAAGTSYLVRGGPTLRSGSLAAADAKYAGEAAGDNSGYLVAGAHDVNADGYADFLIGAPNNADGGFGAGAAYLILGSAHLGGGSLGGTVEYIGEGSVDYAGTVAGAGDVNGDGYADVLVGAYCSDRDGSNSGAAYLILGSGSPAGRSLRLADAVYGGGTANEYAGWAVGGGGDVDGDGYDDLLVGASARDYDRGAAYLVLGASAPASMSLPDGAVEYSGSEFGDRAGRAVSVVGDVNSDGYADIGVGAYNADSSLGAAYLVLGGPTPASQSLDLADAEYDGSAYSGNLALWLSAAGDVNADGYDDVLVGSGASSTAYLINGAASLMGTSDVDDGSQTRLIGSSAADGTTLTVAGAGDVDADGFDDVLVGALYNSDAGYQAGAAYVVLGTGW